MFGMMKMEGKYGEENIEMTFDTKRKEKENGGKRNLWEELIYILYKTNPSNEKT